MLPPLSRRLFAVDVLTVLFSAALAVVAVVFRARLPEWRVVLLVSAAIVAGLPALAVLRHRIGNPEGSPCGNGEREGPAHTHQRGLPYKTIAFVHDWAFAPIAYVLYLQMQLVVGPVRGAWVADPTLIAIDRWLFGRDPSLLLASIATPWLTELLQLAYTSFYALVVAVGAELYLGRDRRRFHFYAFSCAVGFTLSFAGYLAVPAVGPRFTLFDIPTVEGQLPGLFLTPALRAFVDGGGLVPPGLTKEAALALAPRDVFPSGHTMMTLVAVSWAWHFRLRVRWAIAVIGALLVFSTVYLRYHYAIDVLAGAAGAAFCIAISPAAHRALGRAFHTRA